MTHASKCFSLLFVGLFHALPYLCLLSCFPLLLAAPLAFLPPYLLRTCCSVAKGRVAQMESELSDVSSQLTVMTSVATQLKGHLLKAGKAAVKGLTLDRLEQRAYDTLPAGTGAGAGSA